MLKNLLKSSASAFVLLGALSTFDPSQGGNTHPGGNGRTDENEKPRAHPRRHRGQDERTQEKVSPELQDILTPIVMPSAGNHNQEETSSEQKPTRKSKKKLVQELKKASTHNREHSDFSQLPAELTQYLFLFHLDPKTILQTQLVCKNWNHLILDGIQTRLNVLRDPSKEDEKKNPKFLRSLLFHPSTLIAAHRELASRYFEEVICPTLRKVPGSTEASESTDSQGVQSTGNTEHDQGYQSDEFSKNGAPQTTQTTGNTAGDDLYVPESIETFTSVISRSPDHHRFLARMYVSYDPSVDFKDVFLASHTIKESPELQDLIRQVLKVTAFNIEDFPQLVKNQENHLRLKRHLMALKLLALIGDEDAKEKMSNFFENYSFNNYLLSFRDNPNKYLKKNPDLYHPIWLAYIDIPATDHSGLYEKLNFLIQSKYSTNLNLEAIRACGNYLFTIDPLLKASHAVNFYSDLEAIQYSQTGHTPSSALLSLLEEKYEATDKRYLPNLVNIAEQLYQAGHYNRAQEILKDAHERVGNSPFRFQILWQMAECILASGDTAHFDQAGEYLKTILEEYERQGFPLHLDINFVLPVGEGVETQNAADKPVFEGKLSYFPFLEFCDVLMSRVAFHIYKENYKDAEGLLKEFDVTSEVVFEHSPGLMKAIQTQLPHMPKSLIKIFSEELRRFSIRSLETPEMRKFLYENKDVFKRLLQGHPIDRRKFKKAMKDVPFAAAVAPQEAAVSEGKEKGKEKQKKKRNKKEKKKEK